MPACLPACLLACPSLADAAAVPYWEVVNISHYDLSLELTDEMFSFRGLPVPPLTFNASATLLFSVQQQAVSCVVLNARNLTFQSIALERQLSDGSFGTATQLCSETECAAGGQTVSLPFERRASADASRALSSGDVDLLSISLGTVVLQAGATARLVLRYSGLLGSWPGNSTGLYSSAPFPAADESELEFMVVTQGEPTGTRQMLPCYDQPARKATFGVEVKVQRWLGWGCVWLLVLKVWLPGGLLWLLAPGMATSAYAACGGVAVARRHARWPVPIPCSLPAPSFCPTPLLASTPRLL
jgi:hypothetical protein